MKASLVVTNSGNVSVSLSPDTEAERLIVRRLLESAPVLTGGGDIFGKRSIVADPHYEHGYSGDYQGGPHRIDLTPGGQDGA